MLAFSTQGLGKRVVQDRSATYPYLAATILNAAHGYVQDGSG